MTLLTNAVLKELTELTGIKQKADEDYQVFLRNLYVGAYAYSKTDDEWAKLSKPAQKWTNACTKALDEKASADLPGKAEPKAASGPEEAEQGSKEPEKEKKAMATKAKKANGKAHVKANGKAPAKKAKGKKGMGRPRIDETTTVKRLVKEPEAGNRNEHWPKVPNGTLFSKVRKNKTLLRVVRYWRRNGFVELVTKTV